MESSNDLMVINLTTFEVTRPIYNESVGIKPPPIDNHTAVKYNRNGENCMVLFGGYNGIQKSNGIYEYVFGENKWSEIEQDHSIPSRSNHSAAIHKDFMYIFGGIDDETNKINDLWKFDLINNKWTEIISKPEELPKVIFI